MTTAESDAAAGAAAADAVSPARTLLGASINFSGWERTDGESYAKPVSQNWRAAYRAFALLYLLAAFPGFWFYHGTKDPCCACLA